MTSIRVVAYRSVEDKSVGKGGKFVGNFTDPRELWRTTASAPDGFPHLFIGRLEEGNGVVPVGLDKAMESLGATFQGDGLWTYGEEMIRSY